MKSLYIAETWGPTRPLRLALGGSGSWPHRCHQVALKYTHPVPTPNPTSAPCFLLDCVSSVGPSTLGNKT